MTASLWLPAIIHLKFVANWLDTIFTFALVQIECVLQRSHNQTQWRYSKASLCYFNMWQQCHAALCCSFREQPPTWHRHDTLQHLFPQCTCGSSDARRSLQVLFVVLFTFSRPDFMHFPDCIFRDFKEAVWWSCWLTHVHPGRAAESDLWSAGESCAGRAQIRTAMNTSLAEEVGFTIISIKQQRALCRHHSSMLGRIWWGLGGDCFSPPCSLSGRFLLGKNYILY